MKTLFTLKKLILIVLCGLVFALLLPGPVAYAEGEKETQLEAYLKSKFKQSGYFLLNIKGRLNQSQKELALLKDNKQLLESKIHASEDEIKTLGEQLENLDFLIAQNKEKSRATFLQIAEYENTIARIEKRIAEKNSIIEQEKETLQDALTTYYLHTNAFFDTGETPLLLAFLASTENMSDILASNAYLGILQQSSITLINSIQTQQKELTENEILLEDKREKLKDLKSLLAAEQKTLIATQESKERLLSETEGKQALYEALLELSKREFEQVSLQIEKLRDNYDFFEKKLKELSESSAFNPNSISELDAGTILRGAAPLAWPASPSSGLTALFHDSEYLKTMGVQHNAIDIRVPQGTPVRSAADGVVSKVIDVGFAYSYVIISHSDNFLTLYGHLSEINVTEGQVVRVGQFIGLSGGTPGTKGAGWLTTGAHLHLEVFKNWTNVDPLDYLPLEYVPISSLPERYVGRLTGELEAKKIKRPTLAE